ncbi:MAG: tripartite tricarboxylate transporter substrate binding protein [Burkholderiaceae bacterium]|nr:tripartite tricarboxylate transporter substrate binding protein [Burkholderiaceae bacterium]
MKTPFFHPPRRWAVAQHTAWATWAGLALLASSACAQTPAQAWPSKPISLVVPFPAGGTTDVLARSLAERLAPVLGQPLIVENKPGAGATIGADQVAKSKPDGYTLLVGSVHHTIATSVYKKLNYDFQKHFAPISTIALVPNVLAVQASTPAKNVSELLALLKARPELAIYGSNGNGTAQHLIGSQLQASTGIALTHVPYRGSGPLVTDLLGGQITLTFDTLTPVLPHVKAGKLRPLAVTTATRSPALPDVPTLQEAGLKDFNIGTWFGVLAPAGTPKEVVARLNAEMVKVIRSPEFGKRMNDIGAQPMGNSPEEMARQIREETEKFAALVKAGHITVE